MLPVSYQFCGSFLPFWRDFQLVCVYEEVRNEGWVDSTHRPYMQI
jgi:hypothetical protein